MNKVIVILLTVLFSFFYHVSNLTVEMARERAAVMKAVSPDDPALCNMREPDCGQ